MLKCQIVDGTGSGTLAKVTASNELASAPVDYDQTQFVELAVDNTAYNFYGPLPEKQFIITGIRAKADRQVDNVTDADVVVYEASSIDTTIVDKVLHQEAMVRGESFTLIGLHIKVSAGKWINAKTTDDDIHMTIMGYYVPAVS